MIVRGLLACSVWWIVTTSTFATEPPIVDIAFSPDGQTVVAGSQRGIQVLKWPSLKQTKVVKPFAPNIHAIAFSPAGDHIAVGGGVPADEGCVEVFAWPQLTPVIKFDRHSDSVMDVTWLNDSTIASAGLDHQVIVWDIKSKRPKQVLKGHSRGVTSLTHIPSKNILVSAGIDQSLRVWNTESWSLVRSLGIHTLPVHDLALRPGDHGLPMVASASDDRSVRLWQPSIGRMVRFARLKSRPLAISWTTDGRRILAACTDGKMRVIDPDTVEVLKTSDAIDSWAYSIAVHPTDESTVIGGEDGQIQRATFGTD